MALPLERYAPLGLDLSRLVPIAVEQRRQSVRLMMVVENNFGTLAKAAGAPELVDLEDVVDIPGVIPQKFLRHVTAGAPLDIFTIFFPYPAYAADVSIKYGRKFAAAETGDVHVLARFPGNRQNLVDGKIGMIASVAFEAGQPLDGSEQFVVLE